MPEFRKDPVSDHWVIIAPNRALRPGAVRRGRPASAAPRRCPFCRGHEADTPNAVATYGRQGLVVGRCRVASASRAEPVSGPGDIEHPPDGQLVAVRGRTRVSGLHEVIVEAPDHVLSFGELDDAPSRNSSSSPTEIASSMLRTNPRIAYGQLFKNSGSAAGASLEHTHSQLIGTPIVPTQIQAELARSRTYFERHGRCVFLRR